MVIRLYRDFDEQDVIRLWSEGLPDNSAHNNSAASIQRKLAEKDGLFLVAQVEGKVVGTAMAGYDGHRGWIYSVAVSREYRNRGIARQLIRALETKLAERGCPKVNLQVRSSNQQVVAFYKKLGYAVEERISMGKRLH